ncbi:MAG: hypothetical protein ACK47U_10705 [Verrucomicrobiota bacterium]|jgi:hypothetical protein
MTVAKISLVLAIYFGAIPASILFAHSRGELSLGLLFILAWVVAPYALLALTARFGQFPAVTIGSLVLMIITGLFGSFVYIDSYFHIWSDQQDPLLFAALPIFQGFVGLLSLGLLAGIGAWLAKRKNDQAASA